MKSVPLAGGFDALAANKMKTKRPKQDWIVAILLLLIFAVVAKLSNLEKALAASVTFGVFAAIIQTKWSSRGDWRFWLIISVFAVIHAGIIFAVKFPQIRAGLISLPFALVDGFIILGLTNWVERRFPLRA